MFKKSSKNPPRMNSCIPNPPPFSFFLQCHSSFLECAERCEGGADATWWRVTACRLPDDDVKLIDYEYTGPLLHL